jgi:hypothetical protein
VAQGVAQLRYADEAKAVQELTAPDDVIIISGDGWNPELPYLARRRAVMDFRLFDAADPRWLKAREALAAERVGAYLFCGKVRRDAPLRRERVASFGLDEAAMAVGPECDVVPAHSG